MFSELIIEFLLTKTELSEEELLKAYDDFHEKYPEGEINKTQPTPYNGLHAILHQHSILPTYFLKSNHKFTISKKKL